MLLISRVNEFPNTVNISPGSRIIFPNTKEYILNNHNEWVPIHMMAFEIKNDLVSEDLNSIENFGIYHQNNTSNAKLTKNYPSESAGVLKVYKSNDFVYQEYTVLSGQINENKTYVRSKYVGVWSNWVAPTYISDSEWNTIKNNSHSHSNKTLLDSLNNAQVNNWNKAYSWDNHATQGYIKISDTDTKYVPFIGDSKIKGSLIIQNKETYNNFLPGAFTLALNFNKVTLNDFGIYQNLDNEVNPNYWIGYKDNNNIEKKFVEFNLNQNKFTLGKSAPIYIDTFQLSSINQVSYLTLDNSGKIGKIDGLPLSNFTETDPTVPSFVKAISNQQILNWNNITENYKNYIDDRIIEPNSISTNKLQFGFTSWDNNNSNPYADFLHFGGYQGATSGNQNLILFNKNNFGLRQYQKTSQSTEPYISFVDYWNTNNFKQVDINNWNEAHSWGNHAGLYASVAHSHTIENIKNLQATLDGKVDLVSAQTITGVKNFQNGFDINSYQFRGLNSNVLTIGKNVFGNSLSKIVDSSIAVGNNVFPSMNLQPFDPVTESWNNKGYVGIGSDIFIDYTGDSNYRPDHNAHDSWIGLGRGLGAGFLDGTNVTLVGTGLLGKNDVKYADCVTIIGKGFTNGRKTRGTKTLDPNRVVPSKNGYNVHGMMSDVIGIGHENWIEDINQSVVIGSNLRPYSYVFNSLVLGHHHLNMNFEGTTEQADMYLDSDVIIGMGVGKRSSRHAPSHNLLIGMDYFYSTGGAPNANYRPLIEGRFKDGAQLQVNGTIIGGFEKIDDDLPYLERVTFESVSLPSGVVYNASERSFTFDGTQASTSINLHNIPANPNRYIYIEISSSNHIAGSWGYSVYNAVDSGNGPTDNFVARQTFKTTSPTTFILTTEGNFKGTIHITCDYTDVTLRAINPNILLKDSKERKTFEIRTTQDPSIVSMGLNSGKFLTHGGKTLILGNDILSETPAATNNVLVGNNIFKLGSQVINNIAIGNSIGQDNARFTHSVLIGNGTLQSNFTNNVSRLTIVGHGAGKALTEGVRNNLFGENAGTFLTKGSNNSFLGSASGLIKEGSNNTFIGHAAGGYGLMQSIVNNTIVIGADAAPEVPNNTTTIATAANTDNFLYGTTHSNAFKVRGGTGTRVLLDDGSTKLLAEIEGSTDLSNYVTLNTTQSISGTKTFTSTIVGSINGNAATATKLTTARTINGTSFDGSANITTAQWGTGRNITIGNTTKSVNGSADVSWSLAEIGAAPSTDVVTLTTNQEIGSEKLFTTILKVGNSWGSERGLHFRLGNADNATIEGCNGDISSWWGIGLGHHYTGNYVRTIAINVRSGNITANAFVKSGGTATQVLMADGSVKEQSDFGISSIPLATSTIVGGRKLFSDTIQNVEAAAVTATDSRTYGIQVNAAGQMVVNVPWTNTLYSHPNSGVSAGTYRSVTVNAQGHVTAGTNPTTLVGYGITDAYNKTEIDTNFINKANTNLVNAATWELRANDGYFKFDGEYPTMGWGTTTLVITDEATADFNNLAIRQNGSAVLNSFDGSIHAGGNITSGTGFVKVGGTSTQVLMADGSVKEQSTFGGSGSNNFLQSNPQLTYGANGLNYFNAANIAGNNPGINQAPTNGWHHIIRMNHGNTEGYYADLAISMTDNSGISRRVISNGAALSDWVKLWDSSNFNPSSKADAWENATGIGLSSGQNPNTDNTYFPYFYSTYGHIALATRKWVADNYIPKSHPVYNITQANINSWNTAQTLSVSQSTTNTQISISSGNSISFEHRFLGSFDGSRNPTDIKPNTSPKSIRADFATAGSVGGVGTYAGVLTYAPWDGTSASTGDSSYQLAFINETGINGSGDPGLRLRKGIDTTWGSWISILTSVNGVTLDTAQTISGTKTFTDTTYFPKARIQTDGNIVTDSFGNAFQWNQAYTWGNHATAGYLKSDSALIAGFVNGQQADPYIRHSNGNVVTLARMGWTSDNFVDKWNAQDINGTKKFGSTIIANSGIDVSDGDTWGKFFKGNGDGATIATCNSDIGSWWGFGLGHTYTGNYTRTIAFDCRTGSATYTGSITANSFIKSGGTATQVLMADGSVKNQSDFGGSYTLPTASTNVLGGIKIGYGLTINNQIVDVDAVKYKGNTPALTGNTKNVNGITLSGVYNNGYPTLYGNVLNLQGNGGGQLLAGWNGDTTTGALYYRSLRDNTDNWSDWREIAYTNWVSGNFMSKSGVQTVNSGFTIDYNGVGFKLDANGYPTLYYGGNELKVSDDNILTFTGDADFNGNILTKGIISSEGYSKRGLSDDYLLTANGGATHKQTFLSLDSNGSGNAINLNQDTDFNTITKTGFYRCDTGTNAPSGKSWYHIMIESHENGGGWCKQTATAYSTGSIESGITFTRVNVGGSWQPWKRLITDTDNAGINLLVASKNWSKNWGNNGATIDSIVYNGLAVTKATNAWQYFYQSYNFEVGKTYTLSVYVMCPNNNAINCGLYMFDNWSLDFGAVPSSWKRVSKTFTVTPAMVGGSTNRNVRVESGNSSVANPLYLAGMKLEESNFPSPWSMHPTDIVDTYSPQTIDGNKTFSNNLAISPGNSIYLKGAGDPAHGIRNFSDDTDGFFISTGFSIKSYNNLSSNLFYINSSGDGTFSGNVTANSFIKSGGTATQVLMANGSVKEQSDFGGSYTLPTATTSVLGGIKLSSDTVQTVASNTTTATAGRTYASQVNANGQLVVNVPWTDNNTTYSAGSNLTLTGTTFAVNSSPTFSGSVTANSFKKSGGTSTQILMADGSVKEQSTVGGSNYTAGSNISLTGNTISVVDSPTFSGSVTASAFYESSLRSLKTNIQPFEKSGLDLIKELDIVTFDRKDETAKNKIGIIADDSPKEFLSEELDAVDLYKTVFIQAKAIQELKSEVDELKELVKQLLK